MCWKWFECWEQSHKISNVATTLSWILHFGFATVFVCFSNMFIVKILWGVTQDNGQQTEVSVVVVVVIFIEYNLTMGQITSDCDVTSYLKC